MNQPNDTNQARDVEDILGADVPPPRRTDAAFARSVRDGVKQRRSRAFFALPALALGAAGAAALMFVVTTSPPDVADGGPASNGGNSGSSGSGNGASSTVAVADFADLSSALDEDGLFALPDLDGSSDEELARLDALLDRKIEEASRRKL